MVPGEITLEIDRFTSYRGSAEIVLISGGLFYPICPDCRTYPREPVKFFSRWSMEGIMPCHGTTM